jgi:hypothetical protein
MSCPEKADQAICPVSFFLGVKEVIEVKGVKTILALTA